MRKIVVTMLSLLLVTGLLARAFAQEPTGNAAAVAAIKPDKNAIPDDPSLPYVLIVGDSISLSYTGQVKQLLKGKANVFHSYGNAGGSGSAGPAGMGQWILWGPTQSGIKWTNGKKWDVVHFNFGIWDVVHDAKTGKPGTTPEQYEKNLQTGVKLLKTYGTKIIFGTTTPVSEGIAVKWDGVPPRNEVALKVMQENGVAIDDLYAAILPRQKEFQTPEGVHYNVKGSEILAESVAASIEAQLSSNTPKPATK